jgi:hypothetical protein
MSEMTPQKIGNPFRPGAGHMPPYLAGRETESKEFRRLLDQEVILQNLILTGLRPVRLNEDSVAAICRMTSGYPYFIQYVCRGVFDVWVQKVSSSEF